jgi:hypothetical protein
VARLEWGVSKETCIIIIMIMISTSTVQHFVVVAVGTWLSLWNAASCNGCGGALPNRDDPFQKQRVTNKVW